MSINSTPHHLFDLKLVGCVMFINNGSIRTENDIYFMMYDYVDSNWLAQLQYHRGTMFYVLVGLAVHPPNLHDLRNCYNRSPPAPYK